MKKIRYYLRMMRWVWVHRDEQNCRAKWRRMARELGDCEYKKEDKSNG